MWKRLGTVGGNTKYICGSYKNLHTHTHTKKKKKKKSQCSYAASGAHVQWRTKNAKHQQQHIHNSLHKLEHGLRSKWYTCFSTTAFFFVNLGLLRRNV